MCFGQYADGCQAAVLRILFGRNVLWFLNCRLWGPEVARALKAAEVKQLFCTLSSIRLQAAVRHGPKITAVPQVGCCSILGNTRGCCRTHSTVGRGWVWAASRRVSCWLTAAAMRPVATGTARGILSFFKGVCDREEGNGMMSQNVSLNSSCNCFHRILGQKCF